MADDQHVNIPKPSPTIGVPLTSPPGIIPTPAATESITVASDAVLIRMSENLEAALARADVAEHKLGEIILILNNPKYRMGPMVDTEPIVNVLGLEKIWKGY